MATDDCLGSHQPFTPGTLSRDGEVAKCPVCNGNYYVTDNDVIEAHPKSIDDCRLCQALVENREGIIAMLRDSIAMNEAEIADIKRGGRHTDYHCQQLT